MTTSTLPSTIETAKLSDLGPQFKKHLKPSMIFADKRHHRCHGRGRVGVNLVTGANIPCSCLMVDLGQLRAAIQKEIDERTAIDQANSGAAHVAS